MQEFTSLGINYSINELNKITDLNLESKILEMEKLSSVWRSRNLTLFGKITIIKNLMIYKVIHILLSLPRPSEESFKKLKMSLYIFYGMVKPRNLNFLP